jgi:predicted DNA-binding transcriptional regulator YafY
MPINRNALVRFKTIDICLQNHFRSWTLEDLVEACSDALYEYEGITKGVSKRSVQADLQIMRSDKLGYNAPIVVVDKKYYEYEDRKYSITNIPITGLDLSKLSESVEFLKQFKGFSHFKEIEGLIQKLEDHVYSKKHNQRPIIDFDRNENVKGLEFLDLIYQAILQKLALKIWYKSYRASNALEHIIQPIILKEFRNRWYIIARKLNNKSIINFALDRIKKIEKTNDFFDENIDFDPNEYYKNVIGVTVEPNSEAKDVKLLFDLKTAPYVITKPIHPSQKIIKESADGVIISLQVQHNFELEKEILSFGDNVKVLSPVDLKKAITSRILNAADNYSNEITEKNLKTCWNLFYYKGYSPLKSVYSKKEINQIKHQLDKYKNKFNLDYYIPDNLFESIKPLKNTILNFNFGKLISTFSENYCIKNSYIVDGYNSNSEEHPEESNKTTILFRIPLDIDKNVPDFFNITPIKLENSARNEDINTIYLLHGSILLSKKELIITQHNPEPKRKNRVLVLEVEIDAKH